MIKIIPAILTDNLDQFTDLFLEYKKIFKRIEVDICSVPFTPNSTLGIKELMPVLLENVNETVLDFHLMERDPLETVEYLKNSELRFSTVNIYIHQESDNYYYIKDTVTFPEGWSKCAAIKTESELLPLEAYLNTNEILFLAHEIGKQKAKFNSHSIKSAKKIRDLGYSGKLRIDGGVNDKTASLVKKANLFDAVSVGSYFQDSSNYAESLTKLESLLN